MQVHYRINYLKKQRNRLRLFTCAPVEIIFRDKIFHQYVAIVQTHNYITFVLPPQSTSKVFDFGSGEVLHNCTFQMAYVRMKPPIPASNRP